MEGKFRHAWKQAKPIVQPAALIAGVASQHLFAQGSGTIDTAAFTTAATSLLLLFQVMGVAAVVGGLIFCIFKFIGRDWSAGAGGVIAVIVGAIVIGYARTWATALTGIAI